MKHLTFVASFLLLAGIAMAQPMPGRHPHYASALSDLRTARWLLDRPAEYNVARDQRAATDFINRAIDEIKRASIDDGRNPDWHAPVDTSLDRRGRLQKASELIEAARRDLSFEEDNYAAAGWRGRAMRHVDDALAMTRRAMSDKAFDRSMGR